MHIRNSETHPQSLSTELHELAERFRHHAITVEEVIGVLGERAYTLLIILFALPFSSPVTLPGMSAPLGLMIAIMAGRFALGLPPWLPGRLRRTVLTPGFFRRLLEGASRIIGLIERVLRARLPVLTATTRLVRLHAVMVCIAGCILLIPAPIPFSNTLPAFGVLLGAAGVMERDGLAILAGYVFTALGAAYFALIAVMGAEAWVFVRDGLTALF
ncbi:MAG TPA: exopolysaccharide biosynthesis protein [Lacunisphaera sp.]|jgi:hypothetical protein|nr:exopolysaccharide biosynthesis protein [Lacunisphaera sp.]